MNAVNQHVLATDLGGTNIRVALVDQLGNISYRNSTETLSDRGIGDVINRWTDALKHVMDSVDTKAVIGLGVAFASPIDHQTGVVYNPPHLSNWDGFSPKSILEQNLSMDVTIGNDASLAVFGEYLYGAGRGFKNMVLLTIGTGIGGGIVMNGEVYVGHRGFAGEIGHIVIDKNGPLCDCGVRGCLQSMCSGTAISRIANEMLTSEKCTILRDDGCDNQLPVTAQMVVKAARAGDGFATTILDKVARNLGIGIAGLIQIFDPEIIIIGGGISSEFDLLHSGILKSVDMNIYPHLRGVVPVVKAERGDDAGMLGAAALMFRDKGIEIGT